MASPSVDVATGVTISFATSGYSEQIVDVTPYAASRDQVQTSHQGTTTAHTFSPTDLIDWGEMSLTVHANPDTDPPVGDVAETITITFPSGATAQFTGFVTGYSPSWPLEGKATAEMTVKISGDVTITGA